MLNACLYPCPSNPSITIYECERGEIPNLDAIPEVGCFAVRYLAKIKNQDFRLSPKNEAGLCGVRYLARHLRVSAAGWRQDIRRRPGARF